MSRTRSHIAAAAVAAAFAVLAAVPVARADDADKAAEEFTRQMRYGAHGLEDTNKIDASLRYLQKAEEALKQVEAAKPDHPKIPEMRKQLAEARAKVDLTKVQSVRNRVDSQKRFIDRHFASFDEAPQKGDSGAGDLARLAQSLESLKKALDDDPTLLDSEPGRAYRAEVETYVAGVQARMGKNAVLAEARELWIRGGEDDDGGLKPSLDWAEKAMRNEDPDNAIQAWDRAKKVGKKLKDKRFAEFKEVQEYLARYAEVEARVAKELLPLIAAAQTKPLVDETRDALERLIQALDHEDKVSAERNVKWLVENEKPQTLRAEWKDIPDVKELLAEVDEAIARAESELGIKAPKVETEKDDVVPRIEVDYSADVAIQEAVKEIQNDLRLYRDGRKEAKERLADLDMEVGSIGPKCDGIYRDVESQTNWMIDAARRAEKKGKDLAKKDAKNPAAAAIKEAVPKMVKAAKDLKTLGGKRCDYSSELERAHSLIGWESTHRDGWDGNPDSAVGYCAESVKYSRQADVHLQKCIALLPDDHASATKPLEQSKKWREDAEAKLVEICRAEVKRIAEQEHDAERAALLAKQYIETLRETLPDSPVNAEIGKLLGGTAARRAEAEADIKRRHELLDGRAREAAKAARAKFDAFKAEKKPVEASADQVVESLDQWKGKYVTFKHRWLSSGAYAWDDDSRGEIWSIDFAEEVRAPYLADIKKMEDWVKGMAEAVLKGKELPTEYSQRYVGSSGFENTEIVCEIVGKVQYTPKREVRDEKGRVVGSIDGTPYPVPKVVIRAVASDRYVIVPGANSLDAVKTDGFMPEK